MNKQTASLISLLVIIAVVYYFRNQISNLLNTRIVQGQIVPGSFSGAPTPGWAALTNGIAGIAPGNAADIFGGFGVPAGRVTPVSTGAIGVSNTPAGDGSVVFVASSGESDGLPLSGLGITGYD